MPNRWINLSELSATVNKYQRTDYGDGVDRRRNNTKLVRRNHHKIEKYDSAADRDQEDEPDRQQDERDVERGDDR